MMFSERLVCSPGRKLMLFMKARCMQIEKSLSAFSQRRKKEQTKKAVAFGISPGNGKLYTQNIPHTVALNMGGMAG